MRRRGTSTPALQALIHPDVGLELLSNAVGGFDLRPYDIDGPLPPEVYSHSSNAGVTSRSNVLAWAQDENLSIRELFMRFAGARGQRTLVGSAVRIADEMEAWFKQAAAATAS